jgi:hypothetical protein
VGDLAAALPGSEWEGSWQPWVCMTDPESYGVWITGDISGASTSDEREAWAGQIKSVLDDAGWNTVLGQSGEPGELIFAVRSPEGLIDDPEAGRTGVTIEMSRTRPARFTIVSPCVEAPRWLVAQVDAVAPW